MEKNLFIILSKMVKQMYCFLPSIKITKAFFGLELIMQAFISLRERLLKGNFEKYKGITAKTEDVVF